MSLASIFGASDNYQASNPYDQSILQTSLNNGGQLYAQQQGLAKALFDQSNGQGPNPALSQLQQTTQQNAQSAAGLLSSQRGLNPALAARMAAQAQTNANQQAGGQAATLSAQQQLGAQGQLAGVYSNMAGQQLTQQGLYAQSQNAANTLNAQAAAQNSSASAGIMGGILGGLGSLGASALKAPIAAAHGAIVPGRAKVPGDSTVNDTVDAKLSPGEIVIPRSHADNAKDAKDFIDALMKKKKSKAGPSGFGKVLEAHRALTQALQAVK